MSNLSRISQLTGAKFEPFYLCSSTRFISLTTGFSDPIYAEAYVKMHGFDILLGLSIFFSLPSDPDTLSIHRLFFQLPVAYLLPRFVWFWIR